MRAYLSNILKISEYTLKNEINIRYYARWAHRRPAKVFTDEFEIQDSITSKKEPKYLDDNIIELNPAQFQQTEHFNKHKNVQKKKLQENTRKQKTLVENAKEKTQTRKLFDLDSLDAQTHFAEKLTKKEPKKEKKEVKYTKNEVLNTTFDKDGNYVYEKMKDNDPKIGTLMLMVKSRKLRKRKESILLEGKRIIRDALEAGCCLEHLLFSRKTELEYIKDLLPKKDVKLYKMAYRDMQMWSDLTTCPGIMGIFKAPNVENIMLNKNSLPLTIICDNIREPGNLGAILRASAAVGCEKIILTKGCVDQWEPKVLRSATGAHFRLLIQNGAEWSEVRELINNKSVFLADNNVITSDSFSKENLENLCTNVPVLPYFSVDFSKCQKVVLIIGGETFGLSEDAYKIALELNGVRLNIPLENKVESLNTGTALGIIAFEMKRQLLINK